MCCPCALLASSLPVMASLARSQLSQEDRGLRLFLLLSIPERLSEPHSKPWLIAIGMWRVLSSVKPGLVVPPKIWRWVGFMSLQSFLLGDRSLPQHGCTGSRSQGCFHARRNTGGIGNPNGLGSAAWQLARFSRHYLVVGDIP